MQRSLIYVGLALIAIGLLWPWVRKLGRDDKVTTLATIKKED